MRVSSDRAAALYRAAGAQVAGQLVRFDLGMVGDLLRNVPPAFTLSARNPAYNLSLGGNNVVFASVGGPAFMVDNGKGRREGKFAEMWDYLKLVQSPNVIHQEGGGRSSRWICLRTSGICTAIRRRSLTLIRLANQSLGHARTMDGIAMATLPGLIRVDICPAQLSRNKADMVLCGNVGAHIATLLTAMPESAPIARTDQTAWRSRGGRRGPRFGRSCRRNY